MFPYFVRKRGFLKILFDSNLNVLILGKKEIRFT